MANQLNTPIEFRPSVTSLTATNGTNAKIVVDCLPPGIADAIVGEMPLPGETVVRQRVRQGGGRVIDAKVTSTDGAAKAVLPYIGDVLTDQTNAGVLALTTGGVTRTAGSFVADRWTRGDAAMLFGPATAPDAGSATQANVGLLVTVTAVSALALTVNGTPFVADAALPAGARLVKVGLQPRRDIAANAGNAANTPAVPLMGGAMDPSCPMLPDTGWELGPKSLLIVALAAAASALPARVDITAGVAIR